MNYDLMLTLRNAFSIFISNRDVMYLSDIKSYNRPITIYNHPTAIYNHRIASDRNDYFAWMEQLSNIQTLLLLTQCELVNYDLMLTLRNAFSIFISNRDVMYLSDIKSYNHPIPIYNHPSAIYICPSAIYICPSTMTTLYRWSR